MALTLHHGLRLLRFQSQFPIGTGMEGAQETASVQDEPNEAPFKTAVDVHFENAPRFDVSDATGINQYLDTHGYVVIAAVASPAVIAQGKLDFWNHVERVGHLKRSDATTWDNENWLPSKKTGIFNTHGINHSSLCWNIRCLPKVKQAFGAVWQTEELIVSFDACNVFRPWSANRHWKTMGGWWHVDQNALNPDEPRQGKVCVQGLVTLYDTDQTTGGLCVIPGSHRLHDEFCQRVPGAEMMGDFVQIPLGDKVLQENDGLLVGAKAGDLILWDSRTIHCNTPALPTSARVTSTMPRAAPASEMSAVSALSGALQEPGSLATPWHTPVTRTECQRTDPGESERRTGDSNQEESAPEVDIIRLVVYVCMLPHSLASPAILEQRKFQFLARMGTSHWPVSHSATVETILSQRIPPCELVDDVIDPAACSSEMLRLVGYSQSEITNLRESSQQSPPGSTPGHASCVML